MKKILLIAGHGGTDPGACATISGKLYREAEETRRVVSLLRPILAQYAQVDVYDTTRDAFADCKAGTLAPKVKGYDYVLEVHFNSCVKDLVGNGRTTGSEIFYSSARGNKVGPEDYIMNNLKSLGFTYRKIAGAGFGVIGTCTRAGSPANLVEVCFIDDADDMKLYNAKLQQVAAAIANGVLVGLKITEDDENMTVEQFSNLFKEYRKTLQDNDSSSWSAEARNWASANGIITGSGGDNFMWEDMLSREQFVTMLYRFAKYIGKA